MLRGKAPSLPGTPSGRRNRKSKSETGVRSSLSAFMSSGWSRSDKACLGSRSAEMSSRPSYP